MAEVLSNSVRRLYKATYEPREIGPETARPMAVEKVALLRGLALRPQELTTLRERVRALPDTNPHRAALERVADIAATLVRDGSLHDATGAPRALAPIEPIVVAGFGRMATEMRRTMAREVGGLLGNLRRRHMAAGARSGPPAAEDVLSWAATHRPGAVARGNAIADRIEAGSIIEARRSLAELVTRTDGLIDAFLERTKLSPVGWLHLERVEMTPAGDERGELVYSIALAPGESVNISHREWSIRNDEFERIVQDSFEGFSEEGVAEKHDVSMSTESQARHSAAYSFGASYSGFGVSVNTSLSGQRDETRSQKQSLTHAMEVTRKASARARKDHKVSFKVSTVVGEEDHAVRVIHNPSQAQTMRVDHFRLMRKWRVDLYRYDVRMTYDLVIPSPGADLMRKQQELRSIEAQLARPFTMDVAFSEVTPERFDQLVADHGVALPRPPRAHEPTLERKQITFQEADPVKAVPHLDEHPFEVPAGNVIDRVDYYVRVVPYTDTDSQFGFAMAGAPDLGIPTARRSSAAIDRSDALALYGGRSGRQALIYSWFGSQTFTIQLVISYRVQDSEIDRWRTESWNALRQAAQEAHDQRRAELERARNRLLEQIGGYDALTLRKMEREEIMKVVLRWLFGPQFELAPEDVAAILRSAAGPGGGSHEPHRLTEAEWLRIIQYGEWIKFLHHAIEWENMLYFLYPYFWGRTDGWDEKLGLTHPDPTHREFLRAGSARVVLTIRRGFEDSFARVVELGTFDEVAGTEHPYVAIGEEIRRYADASFPFLPAANPDDNERSERGLLVGTWFEYTPTGALDIAVALRPVEAPA